MQADAVVSYPVPLCEGEVLKLQYVTEADLRSGSLPAGCVGSVLEPAAEPGYLCVFRGGGDGALETQDVNAKFLNFRSTIGAEDLTSDTGELVVFRTTEFNELARETLKKEAHLTAEGSWVVTSNVTAP